MPISDGEIYSLASFEGDRNAKKTFVTQLQSGLIDKALRGFMSARCDVSSQHKLPTREEILATQWALLFPQGHVKAHIEDLLRSGDLRRYGPYISDRDIEVL
jgi:hypothetical protein